MSNSKRVTSACLSGRLSRNKPPRLAGFHPHAFGRAGLRAPLGFAFKYSGNSPARLAAP
jgi:hypothetical protein